MGYGDPDHKHPLQFDGFEKEANCFRCQLPIRSLEGCYGCTHCDHYVHRVCFNLPEKMRHPLHPEHSLTLLPPPSSQITDHCNKCHKPFLGGYKYCCQECLSFNLHLKCFLALNLEEKHSQPLSLGGVEELYRYEQDCGICGLPIDQADGYMFACDGYCEFYIHFDCTFIQPKVKHHHVHELTFDYNYPKESNLKCCDVCEEGDGKDLDRTLSYYYCSKCDYIAHVRCVTSKPEKVTTQFDAFIHEHPMIYLRNPNHSKLTCAACEHYDESDSFYFCIVCNYGIHKSCAHFPRVIKHPRHEDNHTLSLRSCASQDKDNELLCSEFCTKERGGKGWIFQCTDCDYAVHLSCARKFKHPFYEERIFTFSTYEDTRFRCEACGELGDGFRMSARREYAAIKHEAYDLHLECFGLPGQIEHSCHLHPLYLVPSPTEIGPYLPFVFQCGICHTETGPDFWIYCCEQCTYFAHLKCVFSDLLSALGQSNNLSNLCSASMCENEKFRISTKPVESTCSRIVQEGNTLGIYSPVFSPRGIFDDPKPPTEDVNGLTDATGLDKPFTDVLHCPKCEQPISARSYSCVYDWLHRNIKDNIYTSENQTPIDYESLAQLDDKVVDELYCPICNLLIFPPTYSCAECQIFFHKSCAELPRKYTENAGHTFVLRPPPVNNASFINCNKCECPLKGYTYFCTSCEIGFDVTCALGAPLLKLENQKHSLFASSKDYSQCRFTSSDSLDLCTACNHPIFGKSICFICGAPDCGLSFHVECAILPSIVKVERRIHHHPLVLEPHLDLSVDDYVCDVCEKSLNPCIWVYRCSDSCGDRATSHVTCIVSSRKKKCHFIYDEECSYPHLDKEWMSKAQLFGKHDFLKQKIAFPDLVAALVNKPPEEQRVLLFKHLKSFVDELEHEYCLNVTGKLLEMDQSEVLHLMEFPDALRAKVERTMKDLALPMQTMRIL